jgi:hypothetical protein
MARKPKPPQDDPAQSKRFIDMAREIGADETESGRKAFERAFDRIVPPKARRGSARAGSGKRATPRKE